MYYYNKLLKKSSILKISKDKMYVITLLLPVGLLAMTVFKIQFVSVMLHITSTQIFISTHPDWLFRSQIFKTFTYSYILHSSEVFFKDFDSNPKIISCSI
jgi:Na+/H+ antiporter NhaC